MEEYSRSLNVSGGRRISAGRLHVTLAFVGAVDETGVHRACEVARLQRPEAAQIHFDQLRFVRRSRMLWALASQPPPSLSALAGKLVEELRSAGFQMEGRDWKPHVTLMRRLPDAGDLPAPDLRWALSGFSLMRSKLDPAGARYQELAHFPAI